MQMSMLYDSEAFVVVHVIANQLADGSAPKKPRHGFEIVDKRSNKGVYLDGNWAEFFERHIKAWQIKTPEQDEVEALLDSLSELAQNPLIIH